MDYDVLLRLSRQRNPCPIDTITGRIVTVDQEYGPVPSMVGAPQMVQDVVLETPLRVRIAIMFMDPRKKSFQGRVERGDDHPRMLFEQNHVGSWIKLSSRHDADQKKSSLKTVPGHLKPAQHWAKKGVMVMVKATPSVQITPLLDQGQSFPAIRYPSAFHKRKKELRVPGTSGTPHPTNSINARKQQEEGEQTMDMRSAQKRIAFAEIAILSALQGSYFRASGKKMLDMPPDNEFETAATTCFMELKKVNFYSLSEDDIRARARRITDVFVLQQIEILAEIQKEMERNKAFVAPPSHRLPKLAQVGFIELGRSHKVSDAPQTKGRG